MSIVLWMIKFTLITDMNIFRMWLCNKGGFVCEPYIYLDQKIELNMKFSLYEYVTEIANLFTVERSIYVSISLKKVRESKIFWF